MTKLTRILITGIILLFHSLSSHAVLKGNDINETTIMLGSELEVFLAYINSIEESFLDARDDYKLQIQEYHKELSSAKLSLYSQQEQYIFGNAFASENAQKLCHDFHRNKLPIVSWKTSYERSISRCEQLQKTLEEINPEILNNEARKSRQEGINNLDLVLTNLKNWHDSISTDMQQYEHLVAEVDYLQKEIDQNYNYILNSLLLLPDREPTHNVFGSEFISHLSACTKSMASMFTSSQYYGWDFHDRWATETYFILLSGLIAFIVGFLLGSLFIFKRLPQQWEFAHKYPVIFHTFCGWVAVTLTYFIIRFAFTNNPFFESALNLAIEMCLLCIFLIYSVLLRVRGDQLIPTIISYLPLVVITLFIILYRITLVNIYVIRITYPILLLASIIAQLAIIIFLHKKIMKFDRYVSFVAITLTILCFAMNFFSYYYLSIHIALAWSLYINGLLVLSCYYYYLERCERYWRKKDEDAYLKSWRPFTFNRLFKPMALIIIFITCTIECAHVFNINEWLNESYSYDFINYPGIACISLRRIFHIALVAVLINYLIGLLNYILRRTYKEKADVGVLNLSRKVFSIVVWGAFIIIALAYIKVNSVGIIATLGGMAVGLGVALRDTFDCLLCGIMLMMGRIKIGDIVEIGEGIRGKVTDIQYRTTLIETDDGAIISVFNTQFFGKDFRNVSYSGKYQRLHLNFKVQKEIDSPAIRQMLAQALIDNVPELAKSPAPKILFGASDRFYVEMIAQVWVPVMDYYEAISNVKETLFNTLKAHGMSNMSVDSRVRLIKHIVEDEKQSEDKK